MGLAPYHKSSYRPYRNRRRMAVVIAVVAAVVLVIAGALVYAALSKQRGDATSAAQQQSDAPSLLTVVNRQNPLPADYEPALTDFGGFRVHPAMLDDLTALTADAAKQGIDLPLAAAYVSYDGQGKLYQATLDAFMKTDGYTAVRAEAEAEKLTPKAGCSEAQTGLLLVFALSDPASRAYLERSCVNFGFIERYPADKQDVTHHAPNECIYRYVGREDAVKIRSLGMCLEEYIDYKK